MKDLKSDSKTWKDYTFRDFLLGNYSKKFLTSTFMPSFIILFLGGLFAAYMLYPEHYSIATHSISRLGNYFFNTSGWWGFSLSLIVGCFALLSFTYYIYQRIQGISPKLGKLFLRFYQITCTGMFLIAFIADTEVIVFGKVFQMKIIHLPIATILFSCFIFGSVTLLIAIFRDNNIKKGGTKYIAIRKILPSLVILGIAVLGSGVTQPWGFFVQSILGNELSRSLEFALSTPMWEWILFLAFITFFSGIVIAVPDTNKSDEFF